MSGYICLCRRDHSKNVSIAKWYILTLSPCHTLSLVWPRPLSPYPQIISLRYYKNPIKYQRKKNWITGEINTGKFERVASPFWLHLLRPISLLVAFLVDPLSLPEWHTFWMTPIVNITHACFVHFVKRVASGGIFLLFLITTLNFCFILDLASILSLRKKCPCLELFWSGFSCIRTEYGEIRTLFTQCM